MLGWLFTYGLTFCGAVAGIFRPYVALLIYVSFAILKPESLWEWSVEPNPYSRIVAVAMLIGWGLVGFGSWQFGRGAGIVWALVLYGLWILPSAAAATNQTLAFGFLEKQAKIILPFLVGITLIDSVQKLKMLAWALVLSQGYVAYWFNLRYFRGESREFGIDIFTFAGLDNNSIAIGMCSIVGMAFFLGLTVERLWQRALCFLAAALMAHSVQFMFSRGGMVALVVTGVASLFLVPRQPKHYLYFLLAVVIGVTLAGQEVRDRFFSAFVEGKERDEAAGSRLRQWGYCLNAVAARPLVGVGPDHWLTAREFNLEDREAHSLWLQIAAELGVPGFLFLVSFYGLCMVRLFPLTQLRHFPADPWLQGAARMVVASLIGFVVSAQFVSLKELEQPFYVTLLGAGVLRVLYLQTAASAHAWPLRGQTPV